MVSGFRDIYNRDRLEMQFLRLQIVRFVDEHQPGFVAGVFTDVEGIAHTIIDKVPVIALADLRPESAYPQPGVAACELLEQFQDAQERRVARITIDKPWGLESTSGGTEFIVLQSQISDDLVRSR